MFWNKSKMENEISLRYPSIDRYMKSNVNVTKSKLSAGFLLDKRDIIIRSI